MSLRNIMLIAGEPSGDLLAAELVNALKAELDRQPEFPAARFFGAGGRHMAETGVELAFDMTQHAVVGLFEALKDYPKFKRLFNELLQLAIKRQPDAIICVDFSGFNRRFAAAVRRFERSHPSVNWHPKVVQYVSPQVWASRPKRAEKMARDIDLLLSIIPFEKDWYAKRVPALRVEFVGHPIVDRNRNAECGVRGAEDARTCSAAPPQSIAPASNAPPTLLLLPGSRVGELKRHLPVMLEALTIIRSIEPNVLFRMVLPNGDLGRLARTFSPPKELDIQVGDLPQALRRATVAIASSGTVTLECAYFGVPTVALYKTSFGTYWIARRIAQVEYVAMPNLLADELLFPEFIQHDAAGENIAKAALELLRNEDRRHEIQRKLSDVVASLGEPGASQRAASAIVRLFRQ